MIWFKVTDLSELDCIGTNTLSAHLGIEICTLGEDFIEASMPVDHRTKQPYGMLHGGASVALAETIGSYASHLVVDNSKFQAVGIEINANHVRKATERRVKGKCKPIHLGRNIHVWSIEIKDENEKLVCISRLTVAIIPKN